jgi:ribosomal protein S18 acetylase RimI-like enzyme
MTAHVTIGPAVPDDAGELITVQRAAYLIEAERYGSFRLPPLTETPDQARAVILGGTTVLVARVGHRLAGSVRGRAADGTGHIGRLAVAPDLQGRGLGRRLLSAAEQALAPRVTRFELFTGATSEENLRFYRAAGYTDIGVRLIDDGPGLAYLQKTV